MTTPSHRPPQDASQTFAATTQAMDSTSVDRTRFHGVSSNLKYMFLNFDICRAYWADAGKPGSTGFSNDFENCLIDKNCAEAAVRGYMAK